MSTDLFGVATRITDILAVFDTEGIRDAYPNPSQNPDDPTWVDHRFIFMVTNSDNVISGQGGAELDVKAVVGDTLRWREQNLSLGFEDSAIFYRFAPIDGALLISTPTPLKATVDVPVPNPADPLNPNIQKVENYFWNSVVIATGRVTYRFYLMILNRDGTKYGYFQWDPFITISDHT